MIRRTARLPQGTPPDWLEWHRPGSDLRIASSFIARLKGLAGRSVEPVGTVALLLPQTASVHTFGMGFAVDLAWIGPAGDLLRFDSEVPPRSLRACRDAAAVIELAAVDSTVA